MDCALIQSELAFYHLGAILDADRDRIDAHLLGCQECLRAYFAIKRQIDSRRERPSDAMRVRLANSVRKKFRPAKLVRIQRWLWRPIPLYRGLVAAALVLVVAVLAPIFARDAHPTSLLAGEERVDTARVQSSTLSLF